MSFSIRQGDDAPAIKLQLKHAEDVDLATAMSLTVTWCRDDDSIVSGPATVLDAVNKIVSYEWGATDTAVLGPMKGTLKVVGSTGKTASFPSNNEVIDVMVFADPC